tara:strand:- start:2795 stop:3439 length:645 start_codon:yes stop_codon:yes gene_type:complete
MVGSLKEIFPSLFLMRPDKAGADAPFSYLLKRPAGNILFATKADTVADARTIAAAGDVTHILLGDRHHALPPTEALAKRLGTPLTCSDFEAAVLKKQGVTIGQPLPYQYARLAPDLEVIPTPGHTRGAFSYLWTHKRRKFLFAGDTIVPVEGAWQYWVTKPNRAEMRKTVEMLSKLKFDVILSNSFASTPVAWLEVNTRERATIFAKLADSLKG